jgi:hypothetical protein
VGEKTANKKKKVVVKAQDPYAALREKLIPRVAQALARFEALAQADPDQIETPARCAMALRDTAVIQRLYPNVLDLSGTDEVLTGRMASVLGDDEQVAFFVEEILAHPSAELVAELRDKTPAKRLMRELEQEGYPEDAAEIAVGIRDTQTIRRIMRATERHGLSWINGSTVLVRMAPFAPNIAKKLMQRFETEDTFELVVAGEIAAVLGETETAQRISKKLQDRDEYSTAMIIAGILGDREAAEALLWQVKKRAGKYSSDGCEWAIECVATYNPEAAYALMQALEKAGYEITMLAVTILDLLNTPSR